jgi:ankyrin repeat protein
MMEELGADVSQKMNDGATPLYLAAEKGHLAVVRLLMNFGADVNQGMHDGATPLYAAAQMGKLAVVQCLVKEFGANFKQAKHEGSTPLYVAAKNGYLDVVLCLGKDFGADINQAENHGATPLYAAAQMGFLAVVRCLVKKLGADVDQAADDGATPLMAAASQMRDNVVTFLLKYGANPQLSSPTCGTAANVSRNYGSSVEQTEYLEARTHCAMPDCSGAGAKKCAGCLKVYYCTRECQLMHWSAHKADCKRSAESAKKPTSPA